MPSCYHWVGKSCNLVHCPQEIHVQLPSLEYNKRPATLFPLGQMIKLIWAQLLWAHIFVFSLTSATDELSLSCRNKWPGSREQNASLLFPEFMARYLRCIIYCTVQIQTGHEDPIYFFDHQKILICSDITETNVQQRLTPTSLRFKEIK
jgi:hypothetical protein